MIDPNAIQRWLDYIPKVPDFKALTDKQCYDMIEARTGCKFQVSKGEPLWPHQLRAVCAALYLGRSLCFLGMRTGKTRVVLEWAAHLIRAKLWKGTGIVIVPSPTALGPWRLQIPTYSDLRAVFVHSGHSEKLLQAIEQRPNLIVIPWSSLQQILSIKKKVKTRGKDEWKNKKIFDAELAEILSQCFTLSVIDEIHYCKTPNALTTKIGQAICRGHKYKLGLTGTPYGRHPFDLWAQGYIIDEGKTLGSSHYFFMEAFGKKVKNPWTRFELKFDKAKMPLLAKKLKSFSIAYELEEIRTFVEKRVTVELTMFGEQLALYNGLLKKRVDQAIVGERSTANLFIRLRQLSSGHDKWIDEEGQETLSTLPEHVKLNWLRDKIAEGRFQHSCIIFYNFTISGKQIIRELKRANVTYEFLHGGVTKGRDEMVARFQSGQSKVFVANVGSGAEAIDLSKADYLTFYEAPVSPTKRQQAERRPMAASRGLRPLLIEDIVCSPIEQRVLGFTQEGKKLLKAGVYSGAALYKMLAVSTVKNRKNTA